MGRSQSPRALGWARPRLARTHPSLPEAAWGWTQVESWAGSPQQAQHMPSHAGGCWDCSPHLPEITRATCSRLVPLTLKSVLLTCSKTRAGVRDCRAPRHGEERKQVSPAGGSQSRRGSVTGPHAAAPRPTASAHLWGFPPKGALGVSPGGKLEGNHLGPRAGLCVHCMHTSTSLA